jgi:hypothetical protein
VPPGVTNTNDLLGIDGTTSVDSDKTALQLVPGAPGLGQVQLGTALNITVPDVSTIAGVQQEHVLTLLMPIAAPPVPWSTVITVKPMAGSVAATGTVQIPVSAQTGTQCVHRLPWQHHGDHRRHGRHD